MALLTPIMMMHPIELLSPAKDLETGIAAINCGADAVYLGAARFGARESASNPLSDIQALVNYAHKYWAKVYVTVNTLLYDHELDEAEQLINQLYQIGADALIIQDPGLLKLALPPLPLFASTQMHNHSIEKIAFLEKVGFQRVILARELTLNEIQAIHSQTQVELETFIHGALCVSYSGQCYLSYALGGRSGNRGQCAQPCRRAYSLIGQDGQLLARNRHLLSLRDLNLSGSISELLDAGVTSFKIEGRLKDKAYVMNVVGHYRQLLDGLIQQRGLHAAASGEVHLDFTPDPNKTFNRGYSTYFIHGRGAEIANHDTPKSLGELLGKVVSASQRSFSLPASAPVLHAGDGICFLNAQQELAGTTVHRVEGNTIFPDDASGLEPGMLVYRNHDHVFSEQLRKSQAARKIRLQFQLEAGTGCLALKVKDEDQNQAAFSLAVELTPADQPEKARETIERQLRKLGGTEYECNQVELALPVVPFVPVSALNALRRGAIEELTRIRQQNRPHQLSALVDTPAVYPEKELSFQGNVLNQKAAEFYRHHGVIKIEPAAETGLDLRGRKVMKTRYCLRYQLKACPRMPNPQKLPEPLHLVDEQGNQFPLRFNCKDCVMEVYFQTLPMELNSKR